MIKFHIFQLIKIAQLRIPQKNTSPPVVTFYAIRTTYAYYILPVAITNMHGFRELLSVNKRELFAICAMPDMHKWLWMEYLRGIRF